MNTLEDFTQDKRDLVQFQQRLSRRTAKSTGADILTSSPFYVSEEHHIQFVDTRERLRRTSAMRIITSTNAISPAMEHRFNGDVIETFETKIRETPLLLKVTPDLMNSIPNSTVGGVENATKHRSNPNCSTAPSISNRTNNSLTAMFRPALLEKPPASLLGRLLQNRLPAIC
jgi:hypothetical protein